MSIILFLIILAVLVLVHEFGHFIVAKKSGIRVDEFGLGFPPKLWGKKWGSTTYTLNAIPFGGFVKIFGEDPHAEEIPPAQRKTSFYYKPKWVQALVLVAGVSMNILFAWFALSAGFLAGMPTSADYAGPGRVSDVKLSIVTVLPGSPAEKTGLISGDSILYVQEGNKFLQNSDLTADSFSDLVSQSSGNVTLTYERGKAIPQTVLVEPEMSSEAGKKIIGVTLDGIGTLKLPLHLAVWEGAKTAYLLTEGTARSLFGFFAQALRWKSDLSQVSGPIGIAKVVGEANSLGFSYLLSLVALISINLAIINLLPFPALDGGRLLFVLIEAATRRKIPSRFVRWANLIGFGFLLLLMAVVSVHDIARLF
jgi:regulator of sigma E protease